MRVALQRLYPTGFWNISHLEYEYDTLCIKRLIFKTTLNLSIYISSFLYTSFLLPFHPLRHPFEALKQANPPLCFLDKPRKVVSFVP